MPRFIEEYDSLPEWVQDALDQEEVSDVLDFAACMFTKGIDHGQIEEGGRKYHRVDVIFTCYGDFEYRDLEILFDRLKRRVEIGGEDVVIRPHVEKYAYMLDLYLFKPVK